MSITAIPHPSDLDMNQVIVSIQSYDEFEDTFQVHTQNAAPNEGQVSMIPAMLIPRIVGQYGEPCELVGRQFLIQM